MNKTTTKEKKLRMPKFFGGKPLISQGHLYVMISHVELDDLIASLMHVAELDSDKEHREALKGEMKIRVRNWLDNQYYDAGYRNYEVVEGATVVDVPEVKPKEN